MLVLSRRMGETVVIDGHILVTVVSIGDGRVRLGIDSPPHVRVDRSEVSDRRKREEAEPTTGGQSMVPSELTV